MKRIVKFACIIITAALPAAQSLADSRAFSISPTTNHGAKWRIGYYEGGPYEEYNSRLRATVEGLMDLGWVKPTKLPDFRETDSKSMWQWLVNNISSRYLEFVQDGFYSSGWDNARRTRLSKRLNSRLAMRKDIDLMLALGTGAGQDLANDEHNVPTLVITTTDPIKSGIVKSVEDSGRDHIHARVDPLRNERQIQIFHDIVGFERIGLAYENSEAGRNYAAVETVKSVGKARGFEVVECHTQSDIPDISRAGDSVIRCFKDLVRSSDAIYVTMQGGVNRDTIPILVEIANKNRIPTLSQIGEKGVRSGFLMSVSSFYASQKSGRFYASVMARIFNGSKPRDIGQVLEESPKIAINLKTAEVVGLYLKADILAAADNVFPTMS